MNAMADQAFEQLSKAVDQLSKAQRTSLLTRLIEQLELDNDPDFPTIMSPEDYRAELDRRINEMDEHPERNLSWEQVKRVLLEQDNA